MENPISISMLNDFIFCPVSIYFHSLYSGVEKNLYQGKSQINGTKAHETIDNNTLSNKKDFLYAKEVYCEKYGLIGKIDCYDINSKTLVERKKKVTTVYDGYIYQIYAQYFAMTEMGYDVERLIIHSIDDNKNYNIDLPERNKNMLLKFESVIQQMKDFDMDNFYQTNAEKCKKCIYAPYCDREVIDNDVD
ncbi:MAG: type V CRISPR-associated protein Cas4 [Clostridia bacterium]|nr:type V CRISPR-associated protein Cas4 [Clostridia bacterium]